MSSIALITATLDLELVRLLRAAMRVNSCRDGLGCSEDSIENDRRFHHQPDPVIEQRKVIQPQPRYEPRPVYHLEPRFEVLPPIVPEPEHISTLKPAFEPVWKTLPTPEISASPAPKVKIVIERPDIVHKGSLIDFFI